MMMDTNLSVVKRNDLLILPDIATPEDRALEKKRIRRHLILNAIREAGPLSRADITRQLGFNSQTVKTMVTELVQEGLVIEKEEERVSGMGRPPTPCRLNPKAAMVLGLAITDKQASSVLLDLEGSEILRDSEETPDFSSPIAEAGWVKDFCIRVLSKADRKFPPLAGVAVGVPQTLEAETPGPFGVLVPSARSTAGVIARAIQRELHLPVLANSQTRLNAIGSIWFGPGNRYRHFVYLDLTDTPRMVTVTNGRLQQGVLGRAGELWEIPLPGSTDSNAPEKKQRLESILGMHNVMEKTRKAGLSAKTFEDLCKLAREGDEKAMEIIRRYALDLSDTISLIVSLINPQALILGGPVAQAGADLLEPELRGFMETSLPTELLMRTEIEFAPDATDDPAACAGSYVLQHIFTPTHFDLIDLL